LELSPGVRKMELPMQIALPTNERIDEIQCKTLVAVTAGDVTLHREFERAYP